MVDIKLAIGDLLGFCDMNGEEALTSEQVERLENYIIKCNESMKEEVPLVAEAIYDRMVEILKRVNPDAKVLSVVWSEDEVSEEDFAEVDTYKFLREEPMRSICTCKSFNCQELKDFVKRLPDGDFDAHISCKENGHGVRLVYSCGYLEDATSRGRSTAGRNLHKQMKLILEDSGLTNIGELEDSDIVEIRGEVVLPFENLDKARQFNPSIVSAFSGVSSMLRDSASDEETKLLEFVAYKLIADDVVFETKAQEYDILEQLGFTTPLSWVIEGLNKDTLMDELPQIVSECEDEVKPEYEDYSSGYRYFTDGLVFEVNDRRLFEEMGTDGSKYNYGNVALKVGYWQQDMYSGYVQTILWKTGKSKFSPIAIVGDEPNMIEYHDVYRDEEVGYISSISEISNWDSLGVITATGNRVRKVPLYDANNIAMLGAYAGELLNFRYGGEAGVVPCYPDGTTLVDGKVKEILSGDDDDDLYVF